MQLQVVVSRRASGAEEAGLHARSKPWATKSVCTRRRQPGPSRTPSTGSSTELPLLRHCLLHAGTPPDSPPPKVGRLLLSAPRSCILAKVSPRRVPSTLLPELAAAEAASPAAGVAGDLSGGHQHLRRLPRRTTQSGPRRANRWQRVVGGQRQAARGRWQVGASRRLPASGQERCVEAGDQAEAGSRRTPVSRRLGLGGRL